ncbi:class I SAM-dependent methyltransferase [Streptomyces sp. WAC 06738]|uniref:class I SAM-dependent methyltransferase n=1 Tax=Streptomyces sp. WAC 06738 TaxID=2203210 RepID=UPI000F6C904E|nr:class I SAM-dependent methyltransferase [Streptomyces sp. WAC 06738]AZM47454.1 class I SAM-dependent methyltransferase [Streptomyces sp. WAC 06738]
MNAPPPDPAAPFAMPRGGPAAARWDRLYETGRAEYIDLPGDPATTRRVLRGLDRFQRLTLGYRTCARLTAAEFGPAPYPRVLELGAGCGRLAYRILRAHPTARVTASDVNPRVVEELRAGPLGRHPRARCAVLDATAIDAPAGAYDVAVMAMSLHHLPPAGVLALLREGTRVARTLLLVDGWRHPLCLVSVPLMFLTGGPAQAHDGLISLRKVYGAAAVRALAGMCGAPLRVHTRFALPGYLVATATRSSYAPAPAVPTRLRTRK